VQAEQRLLVLAGASRDVGRLVTTLLSWNGTGMVAARDGQCCFRVGLSVRRPEQISYIQWLARRWRLDLMAMRYSRRHVRGEREAGPRDLRDAAQRGNQESRSRGMTRTSSITRVRMIRTLGRA
jgi:hypothetical protein